MAIFNSYFDITRGYTPLNPIKPPFSYGFPMVFHQVHGGSSPSHRQVAVAQVHHHLADVDIRETWSSRQSLTLSEVQKKDVFGNGLV